MSADIIKLGDRQYPEGAPGTHPHTSGTAKCLACQEEWTAVAPMPLTDMLECPKCGCQRGVYKYPILRDAPTWECPCGCDLFRVVRDGVYCPSCGAWQVFPK